MTVNKHSLAARLLLYFGIGFNLDAAGVGVFDQPVRFFLMLIMVVLVSLLTYNDGFNDAADTITRALLKDAMEKKDE